jgi:phage shock protein B
MNSVIIVFIVFGSIVALAGLLCGTVLLAIRMRHAGFSAKDKKESNDEAMMIQEIYRGLEKMEHRIEALETILMDGGSSPGDKK